MQLLELSLDDIVTYICLGSWIIALDFILRRLPFSSTLVNKTGIIVGIKDEVWAFGSLSCKLRVVFAAAVGSLPMQILYKNVENICCRSVQNILLLSIQ